MKKHKLWFGTRWGYILMLGLSLGAAIALGGMIPYGTAAALLLVPPAALLMAWVSQRQLYIQHAIDRDNCPRESAVRYSIALRNRGILPVTRASVRIAPSHGLADEPKEILFSLNPLARLHRDTTLFPEHRGIYTLHVENCRVSDPFHLTVLHANSPAPITLTVLPKLIPISEAWKRRLDPQGLGGLFSQSSDEPALDTRAYRYGDSPRRIHWNLTARQRELMVRQYESVENQRLLVILDLSPFEADRPRSCEDALIESCLSVVRYALKQQIETTFLFGNQRFLGHDLRNFDRLHNDMAGVGFNSETKLLSLLSEAGRAQLIYLFCMNTPDDETLSALPLDRPVELAVMRTRRDCGKPPESVKTMRVTVLEP